jgi:translocator protein
MSDARGRLRARLFLTELKTRSKLLFCRMLLSQKRSHFCATGSGRQIAIAALGVSLVLMAGGAVTVLGPWYEALRKPSWQPPGWLFGPVWTLIAILTAIAAVMAWRRADAASRRVLIFAFALNGLLNFLWSVLFFFWRRPDLALIEVAFLWLSIALLIVLSARQSRLAGALLVSYLLWVSFAAFLNWTIVALNTPFAGLMQRLAA